VNVTEPSGPTPPERSKESGGQGELTTANPLSWPERDWTMVTEPLQLKAPL